MSTNHPSEALISIKPQYVKQIFLGNKLIELRRRTISLNSGTRLWIYSTVPEATIKGAAIIDRIILDRPYNIWRKFGTSACISRDEFDLYFNRYRLAIAIKFQNVVPLIPGLTLTDLRNEIPGFHPPQHFLKLRKTHPLLQILARS